MSGIRAHIISEIESFCTETGISTDAFGRRSVGDNLALKKLKIGVGVTLTRIEAIERYMATERNQRQDAQAV